MEASSHDSDKSMVSSASLVSNVDIKNYAVDLAERQLGDVHSFIPEVREVAELIS